MKTFPPHLAQGFQQFRSGLFSKEASRYEALATYGQRPQVMIVSCCDSRVEPQEIFNTDPGDLFVVRNVANLVPPFETGGKFHGVSAALEFAVLNLKVRHIVVMGHSSCGGVKTAMVQNAAEQTEARFISNWMSMLDDAKLSVLAAHQNREHADALTALEYACVRTSLVNLRTFPFVSDLETGGQLSIHGAHFEIKTGSLRIFDQETEQFLELVSPV